MPGVFRKLLIVVGTIEALFPKQVVAVLGKFGYRSEGETEPRDWLVAVTKAEGILLVAAGVLGILATRFGHKNVSVEEAVEEVEETIEETVEVEMEEESDE